MDPLALASLVRCTDVTLLVESLAALGSSTVDLLCAVRLHAGCSLREARKIIADLAPAVQEFEPIGLP